MSPRRSSRSKTSHPTVVAQHHNSSSSSVSSGKTDCKPFSDSKLPSQRSSTVARSPSENREASGRPVERRTRSSQDIPKLEVDAAQRDEENDDEGADEEDEEEVTRCVCGQQEYPGMPVTSPKSNGDSDDKTSAGTLQEDTGGLFIQCDVCKVWQHGGCVGIMSEAASPEEYFCEACRKELHTIKSTTAGQKHSIYRPFEETSTPQFPKSSPRKSKEGRTSRLNQEGSTGKRRSTMNSRDAAYYETEQLRRAIEESKKEGHVAPDSTSHIAKRSRDGSVLRKDDYKRQRTESGSSASSNAKQVAREKIEDETADVKTRASSTAKNIRGAAARNHRNRELREREERQDKDRLDAAGRRKGRAERRRGDESDPSEEPISRTVSSKGADQVSTETPPAVPIPHPPKAAHHKKTGRPPTRRGRVGRNQYTRDRDRPNTPKNAQDANSPPRSHSSKEGGASPRVNGFHQEAGKSFKSRHMNASRTSMIEMKRRVAGILEFISHTQVEIAAESPLVPTHKAPSFPTTATLKAPVTPPDEENGDKGGKEGRKAEGQQNLADAMTADLNYEQFKSLGSLEMMESLSRKLMRWQGEYGKYGDK
ncbi:MAG: hypothetical protein Q9170_000172 [Blastenia crenularia]